MKNSMFWLGACLAAGLSAPVWGQTPVHADAHAPIGVMGDHTHKAGGWMFSYRYMAMDMQGNLDGSSAIEPDTIVTTIPNRFAGMPGMPPTLRIVPLDMQMDMHMLGMMYAPTDRLTLMVMSNYLDKTMNHVTYQGGMGTTELGRFSTRTSGWGDTSITGLFHLEQGKAWRLHLNAGLSLPTGSTDERGQVLTPMGMRPDVRLPYPMQLGSGTYDPILGATIAGAGAGSLSWGAQWLSRFRIHDNDNDYRLGDEHRLTGWLAYAFSAPVSASVRVEYYDRGNISGQDPEIAGPVQTADPARQGGSRTDVALGVNYAAQGGLHGWRLALEYLAPVAQNLDGPQLETDGQFMIGVQYTPH